MSDPRLSSPSTIRLVGVAAAAVASLGVVALGVQLGTNGLVGDGPGRNPGSASATPAAAVVDGPRVRSANEIQIDQLLALVPGGGAFGSVSSGAPSTPTAPFGDGTAAAPTGGDTSGGGATDPGPLPPTTVPPTPGVTVPPTPPATIPPALEPVLAPVLDALGSATGAATSSADPAASADPSQAGPSAGTGTIDGLVRQILGL